MFLPTTRKEMKRLGWHRPDVVLVTGDSYIDSPYVGVSVIGKVLVQAGFRVGIIAQPDLHSPADIDRLGEPGLFWGVTGGCIDSMVANYTPTGKKRKKDDYTPGGVNDRRPDRAVIAYANLIRRYFKQTVPIVIGGIEASLRRVAHYDYWSNRIRRSILFDAKADYLVHGMGEKTVVALARGLRDGTGVTTLPGLCHISAEVPAGYLELPSYESVAGDKSAFIDMFSVFYDNNDPATARGLVQRQDTRYLVQNPPAAYLDQAELDAVHAMAFAHDQHPYYRKFGNVAALDTIRFSITTHRGCYGECNYCAIGVHQGRTVRCRSQASIVAEARQMAGLPDFKGYIQDLGGPTANMYGYECKKKLARGVCAEKRCLFPRICPQLKVSHQPQLELLRKIRKIQGVKKAFIRSGLRYDLILGDRAAGRKYLKAVLHHHISGQLKVAPEHSVGKVLDCMGKPDVSYLLEFKKLFDGISREGSLQQFLTYYLIAAHPGCTMEDMRSLGGFMRKQLKINPRQVQIFTPTPSTWASLMYWTEMDPWTRAPLFVEKNKRNKEFQKKAVMGPPPVGKSFRKKKNNRLKS